MVRVRSSSSAETAWKAATSLAPDRISSSVCAAKGKGLACSLIAVYEGYNSEPTPEGVGLATTRTVVTSSVMVLLLNYLLTAAFLSK